VNDHNNPSLALLPDGNLMIFYSEHNGNAMYFSKTTSPGNISTFRPVQKLPTSAISNKGFTYPNPVLITENNQDKLFLFWRGDDWTPTFSISADKGASWTTPRSMVKNGIQRPYVKYFGDSESRIHMTMTDGHPSGLINNSVYYMYYENGAFYKANNQKIGTYSDMPFSLSQLDKVYSPNANTSSAGTGRAWVWSIVTDSDDKPMIAYSVSKSINNHEYHYAQWTGSTWASNLITTAGDSIQADGNYYGREDYYTGGVFFDQHDPTTIYLSKQAYNKNHVVQEWSSKNKSGNYKLVRDLTSSSQSSFRPYVPQWKGVSSRANSFKVLWMTGEYEYYTDYKTSIEGIMSEESF
jgi:hypothetical protein